MTVSSTPVEAPRRAPVAASANSAGWRAFAFALVGVAYILRFLYAASVELLPEEAYYWNYSRHLDIGYLDHPPMVAWLIRLGCSAFGNTEFGVRVGALCCGVVTAVYVYRLTRNLAGESGALLALALLQTLPFFFFSGILMTPDAPMTAAWAATLYYLERALIGGQSRAWYCAGLVMGLGLLSKYTIGILGVAAGLYMLLDPPSRRWFARAEPYAAILIAGTVFLPVIVWNADHHWASFAFQTSRRLAEAPRFSLHKLFGAAVVLLTPTGFAAASAAMIRVPSGARPQRLMLVALLLPLCVFALFSLRHEVKLDWTGAPWTAAVPLMAVGLAGANARRSDARRWLRLAWPPTMALMPLAYVFGLVYLVVGVPGLGYGSHPEVVPVGWRDLGRQIDSIGDALRQRYGDKVLVVGMDRYMIASELAFYSRDRSRSVAATASSHLFGELGLMYEQWFPPELETGRTLLLVAWDPGSLSESRVAARAGVLEPLRQGVLTRGRVVIRPFYYRIVQDYRYP